MKRSIYAYFITDLKTLKSSKKEFEAAYSNNQIYLITNALV
jgi:hypothetical protein